MPHPVKPGKSQELEAEEPAEATEALLLDASGSDSARHPSAGGRSMLVVAWVGVATTCLLLAVGLSLRLRPQIANLRGQAELALVVGAEPFQKIPSLFCFSLSQPYGEELALVKSQFAKRASIFACNGHAVITPGARIGLGWAKEGMYYTRFIPKVQMSKGSTAIPGQTTNSWLNAKSFMLGFDELSKDGSFWNHDWFVKVDPDAVFFPDRLQRHLQPLTAISGFNTTVYLHNCGFEKNQYIQLLGALEVVSMGAMKVFYNLKWKCESQLPWTGWGEDYYLQHCLDYLGIGHVDELTVLGQSGCEYAPCEDGWRAAFHPFKDQASWWSCWYRSSGR